MGRNGRFACEIGKNQIILALSKMQNVRKTSQIAAFTVIELIIVIAVISILSALIALNVVQVMNKAKRSEARTFIGKLELAISMYRIDTGTYPPDEKGSASLHKALDPPLDHPIRETPGWKGPYLEFKSNEVNSHGQLVDPWHRGHNDTLHIYVYRASIDGVAYPPFHNTRSYDIYSKGWDGKTGTDGVEANEFSDGNYSQNGIDDDGDGMVDELTSDKDKNGYLEDDINNW